MIIQGQVPSKSNSYKVITINGHGSIGKTDKLEAYERSFYLQCKHRGLKIDRPFKLYVDVYYDSNRPDLDNGLKVILDCLQYAGVIKNDRSCIEIFARKLVDKTNPRVEIALHVIERNGECHIVS